MPEPIHIDERAHGAHMLQKVCNDCGSNAILFYDAIVEWDFGRQAYALMHTGEMYGECIDCHSKDISDEVIT